MSEVLVVRGEMQPWTDHTARQPVLAALLADVIPANRRTLILGPHSPLLIESVLAHSADVTILVRSVSDAEQLTETFGPCLHVVAGALDGLKRAAAVQPTLFEVATDGVQPFEVVVAADGLDRVLGYDSEHLSWTERLAAVRSLATPDAVVVLGLRNEFSMLNLLDRRPAHLRHGDDEWVPLHDDPTRPVSVDQFQAALPWPAQLYADFSAHTLVGVEAAATARPGHLPTRLAVAALESVDTPLLTSTTEPLESAARAGLLPAVPTSWLAVCNAPTPHTLYTHSGPTTLKATATETGWETTVGVVTPDLLGTVGYDSTVVPARVPGGESVETVLFRLAAAEDVPGFRKLAAALGEWAEDSRVLLRWDDVIVAGDTFAFGISGWVAPESVDKDDLLAAAWLRFHRRLVDGHRRHPWPPWMIGDELVSTWLSMSGVTLVDPTPATAPHVESAYAEQLAWGKQLAAALSVVLDSPEQTHPDLRTQLADADRARLELTELQGHVFGLERTLGFRNKAMKTRENRIRELRGQLQKATTANNKIHSSRCYALARRLAQFRNPRKVAAKARRILRQNLNKLRPAS
ncbi:hypothetical protein E1263_30840 [Kribbella antibiotica]|uniref:Class I SAM-dependent methyltransferase n=1 Tax=Kribbella antibiotica TaxID=190195 RepID=A0A4V2YMK9_9ACTN|nr:hypothetical protein [Kribbella antibiotica]TDD50617.1 hypothetical protein E1263_30840 [Kribbella antibiotica]